MPFKLEIRSLATVEIIEAFDWYESQREGLGHEFLNELDLFYNKLLQNPSTYGYYAEPVRQGKVNRFPYVIVFEIFDQSIIIYSVFMTSQDPAKKRLG